MTKVTCIVCPTCGDKLFSRAHHDFRSCTCGDVSADEGFEYVRVQWSAKFKERPELIEVEVPETKRELYDDWDKSINKCGIIK